MRRAICSVAGVLWLVSAAYGDGCMMSVRVADAENLVSSPKQEALLVTDGAKVTVVLRTHFRAGPKELAWIVPVPAKPTDIAPEKDELFESLMDETTPHFYMKMGRSHWFGCGCAAEHTEDMVAGSAVTVESTGTAGMFQYAVLSATGGEGLSKWLDENHYVTPTGAKEALSPYIKAGWYFLAMRLRPEASKDGAVLAPHPIRYTYQANTLVYPMIISRVSAAPENEILLYVLSTGRYACANWANGTIEQNEVKPSHGSSPSWTNYEALFREKTAAAQGHLFITEYARYAGTRSGRRADFIRWIGDRPPTEPEPFLTRLRAIIPRDAMDRDVALLPVQWPDVNGEYELKDESQSRESFAMPVIALAGLCAGIPLGRRRGWRRVAGVGCCVLSCLLFAAI